VLMAVVLLAVGVPGDRTVMGWTWRCGTDVAWDE